jgi:hypothetical protein
MSRSHCLLIVGVVPGVSQTRPPPRRQMALLTVDRRRITIAKRLAATHEVDDLHPVTVPHDGVGKERSSENGQIVFDRHAASIDLEPLKQIGYRYRCFEPVRFAIKCDEHARLV